MIIDHEEVMRALASSAYRAYMFSCVSQAPLAVEYMNRVTNPNVGDLVMEVSNFGADAINRIGRLISARPENPPVSQVDPETYDESAWGRPYPPYMEMTHRIRTLDGREFAWTNARFIAIPEVAFTNAVTEWCKEAKQ